MAGASPSEDFFAFLDFFLLDLSPSGTVVVLTSHQHFSKLNTPTTTTITTTLLPPPLSLVLLLLIKLHSKWGISGVIYFGGKCRFMDVLLSVSCFLSCLFCKLNYYYHYYHQFLLPQGLHTSVSYTLTKLAQFLCYGVHDITVFPGRITSVVELQALFNLSSMIHALLNISKILLKFYVATLTNSTWSLSCSPYAFVGSSIKESSKDMRVQN